MVLLLDEAPAVRSRLRALLVQAGGADVRVHEVEDGGDACDFLASAAVSSVILDVHVRKGAGLELLAKIRALAPGALLVVLTNEATELHRRECLRQGADHFFDKGREFERAVEVALRRSANAPSHA